MLRLNLQRPDVTLWLVAINVSVYLLALLCDKCVSGSPAERYLPLPAAWSDFLHTPWTVITYMFTHFSFLHLFFNMLWLWWFGRLTDILLNRRALVSAYIWGGLAGGALYLAAAACGAVAGCSHLVGASASVMCIMTVAAVKAPQMEINFLLVGPVKLKWIAPICILFAFLGLGGGNSGGVVAHIGGVATGVVIAVRVCRRKGDSQRTFAMRRRFRRARRSLHKAAATNHAARSTTYTPEQRLDMLLDKIRISGFDSLSQREREELQKLSKELKK